MKRKALSLLGGLLILSASLSAQRFHLGLGSGLGTFNMSDSREFNLAVLESLPFEAKLTDNFPPFLIYRGEIVYDFPKVVSLGFNVSSTSTGSRICVSDYSGSYVFDNLQKAYACGLKTMAGSVLARRQRFCCSLEGGVIWSFLTLKEDFTIFDVASNNVTDCRSFGLYIQPGLNYLWQVASWCTLGGNVSYLVDIQNNYHEKGDKNKTLFNTKTKEPIKPQWDGIRVSVTLYYSLPGEKKI